MHQNKISKMITFVTILLLLFQPCNFQMQMIHAAVLKGINVRSFDGVEAPNENTFPSVHQLIEVASDSTQIYKPNYLIDLAETKVAEITYSAFSENGTDCFNDGSNSTIAYVNTKSDVAAVDFKREDGVISKDTFLVIPRKVGDTILYAGIKGVGVSKITIKVIDSSYKFAANSVKVGIDGSNVLPKILPNADPNITYSRPIPDSDALGITGDDSTGIYTIFCTDKVSGAVDISVEAYRNYPHIAEADKTLDVYSKLKVSSSNSSTSPQIAFVLPKVSTASGETILPIEDCIKDKNYSIQVQAIKISSIKYTPVDGTFPLSSKQPEYTPQEPMDSIVSLTSTVPSGTLNAVKIPQNACGEIKFIVKYRIDGVETNPSKQLWSDTIGNENNERDNNRKLYGFSEEDFLSSTLKLTFSPLFPETAIEEQPVEASFTIQNTVTVSNNIDPLFFSKSLYIPITSKNSASIDMLGSAASKSISQEDLGALADFFTGEIVRSANSPIPQEYRFYLKLTLKSSEYVDVSTTTENPLVLTDATGVSESFQLSVKLTDQVNPSFSLVGPSKFVVINNFTKDVNFALKPSIDNFTFVNNSQGFYRYSCREAPENVEPALVIGPSNKITLTFDQQTGTFKLTARLPDFSADNMQEGTYKIQIRGGLTVPDAKDIPGAEFTFSVTDAPMHIENSLGTTTYVANE